MPELPEVETTCRGIRDYTEGHQILDLTVRETRLRWPIPESLDQCLVNQTILSLQRRGKYLLFKLVHGTLIIHLGMSGSLRVTQAKEPWRKHDHVQLQFAEHVLRYHDPRRFGCLLWTSLPAEQHKLLAGLGPEPLSAEFSVAYLLEKSRNRQVAIKSLIMNSQIVVGVGNIYASEALFAAGIRPARPAAQVSEPSKGRLVPAIKQILQQAITQGGTSLRDFVNGFDQPGYFKQALQVYGRKGQPCYRCDSMLQEIRLNQRASAFCPGCQQ